MRLAKLPSLQSYMPPLQPWQVTALRPGAGLGLVHSTAAEGATAAKKRRRGGRKARLRKHAEAQRAHRQAAGGITMLCTVHSEAHTYVPLADVLGASIATPYAAGG